MQQLSKTPFVDLVQRVGASQEEKLDNSTKHLQEFLGSAKKVSDLVVDDITFDFVGQFADYLASYAHKGRSKNNDLISMNTAKGYFSAVVNFLKHKFRDASFIPRALQDAHLSKIRSQISAIKFEQARKDNKRAVTPHDKATDEDRKALGALCVWDGAGDSAVFLHLLNSMIHCVGRASEVSSCRKMDLGLTKVENIEGDYMLLSHYMDRIKVNFQQDLSVYPHKSDMLFCYYWSAAYASVMERGVTNYMFPGFFEKANQVNASERYDSTVSKTFKTFICRLSKIAQKFVTDYPDAAHLFTEYSIETFNNSLTSHVGK